MGSHESGDLGRRHALRSQLVAENEQTLKRRNIVGAQRIVQEARTTEPDKALADRIVEDCRESLRRETVIPGCVGTRNLRIARRIAIRGRNKRFQDSQLQIAGCILLYERSTEIG